MDIDASTNMMDNKSAPEPGAVVDISGCMHIHQSTYLATDYLNHFNEIVMLIEMLPELPDVYTDIIGWEPVSYPQHFRDSGFAYADLAVRAYENAPSQIKSAFDALISDINQSIITGRQDLLDAFDKDETGLINKVSQELSLDLRMMIDQASAIINGTGQSAQDQADSIFDSL